VDSGLGMDILKIVLGRQLGEKSGGGVNGNGTTGNNVNTKGKEGTNVASEKEEDDDDAMEGDGGGDNDEMKSLKVVKGLGEDRRVIGAALAAVCNILTDFSPLRPVGSFFFFLEKLTTIDFFSPDLLGRKVDATFNLHHERIWGSFSSIKCPLGCEKRIAQDEYGDEKGCYESFRMDPSR
jgi:hypothetical protein